MNTVASQWFLTTLPKSANCYHDLWARAIDGNISSWYDVDVCQFILKSHEAWQTYGPGTNIMFLLWPYRKYEQSSSANCDIYLWARDSVLHCDTTSLHCDHLCQTIPISYKARHMDRTRIYVFTILVADIGNVHKVQVPTVTLAFSIQVIWSFTLLSLHLTVLHTMAYF